MEDESSVCRKCQRRPSRGWGSGWGRELQVPSLSGILANRGRRVIQRHPLYPLGANQQQRRLSRGVVCSKFEGQHSETVLRAAYVVGANETD